MSSKEAIIHLINSLENLSILGGILASQIITLFIYIAVITS
jgi:hypothetical protein